MQQLDDLKVIVATVIAALQADAATIAADAAAAASAATVAAELAAANAALAQDAIDIQSLHDQLAAALAANAAPVPAP